MKAVKTLIILLCLVGGINAQEVERCNNTVQWHENRLQQDLEYRLHTEKWRKAVNQILKDRREGKNPSCVNGPIKIPVAVHFGSGVVPSAQEACAINVVVDQINEVNNEFAGIDIDAPLINNFTSCFGSGILGDACIEFCLGQYNHPTGYGLTDGDYAVTFGQVSFSIPSGWGSPHNPEWSDYINIYVYDLPGGLLGESNGIPGMFNGDGVRVDNCVFGTGNLSCPGVSFTGATGCFPTYDEGETLAHELGHYLGLYHIWGDNFNCTGMQDNIADTPNMANNYSGYSSCSSHTSCSDLPVTCGDEDMYMNFMSYASDGCMYMFTSGQSDVVNATAVSEGFTTVSSKCLQAPVADFTPVGPIQLCNNDCIDFTDTSTNSPTSWSWSFQVLSGNLNIDISSSTMQNPTLCITSGDMGVLRVALSATNGTGTDIETKNIDVSYAPLSTYYADNDMDGFGDPINSVLDCEMPSGYVTDNTDCDDNDPDAYPGNAESCDGVDNNCDGNTDEGCMMVDCDGDYLIIDNIAQAEYHAEINVNSDAVINNGDDVLFTAGTDIDLNPEFEVLDGAEFEARIESCTPVIMVIGGNGSGNVSYARHELEEFSKSLSAQFKDINPDRIELIRIDNGVVQILNSDNINNLFETLSVELQSPGMHYLVVYFSELKVVRRIMVTRE